MISSRPSRAVPPSSASACLPAMKRISKQLRVECRRLLFLALHFASNLVAPTGGPHVVVQFGPVVADPFRDAAALKQFLGIRRGLEHQE